MGGRPANVDVPDFAAKDGLLFAWRTWVSPSVVALPLMLPSGSATDFSSVGRSGDDAGETGETTVSTMGCLTSLDSYSGVGRRTMGCGEVMLGIDFMGLTAGMGDGAICVASRPLNIVASPSLRPLAVNSLDRLDVFCPMFVSCVVIC